MLTNKQIWEYEQTHKEIKFDALYVEPGNNDKKSWNSKRSYIDSNIRNVLVGKFEYLTDGYDYG